MLDNHRRHLPIAAAVLGVALLAGVATCSVVNQPEPTPSPTPTAAPTPSTAEKTARGSLIFGPSNAFQLDVTRAQVAKTSPAQIGHLMSTQITPNYGGQVGFNAHQFNSSFYVAGPTEKKVRIGFDNCQKKEQVPPELYSGPRYFVDVPMPAGATPSSGTDAAMTIWSPSQDALWEFWVAKKSRGGAWTACWGGRIDHVSKASRGTFTAPYGASASGLATVGSMVTIAEAKALKIDHAVQIALIYLKAGEAVYPANRSDGKDTNPGAIPLGARLRLPAKINVETLPMAPLGKAIARAAQRYGFIVTETSGAVAVGAESPKAALARGEKDPWPGIFGATKEWDVLKGFPWAQLQVIDPTFGVPKGTEAIVTHW